MGMFGKFGRQERPATPVSDKLTKMGKEHVWGNNDGSGAVGSIDNITFEGADARENRGGIAHEFVNTIPPPSTEEGVAAAAALEARMQAKLAEQKAKVIRVSESGKLTESAILNINNLSPQDRAEYELRKAGGNIADAIAFAKSKLLN